MASTGPVGVPRMAPGYGDTLALREVERRAKERLATCRRQIEMTATTHDQTQFLRGQIAALKDILAAVESGRQGAAGQPAT